MIGARIGQLQLVLAARLLRMQADLDAPALKLVAAAQQSADRLANVAAGIGTNLDITV
jgi:hypothetical protein